MIRTLLRQLVLVALCAIAGMVIGALSLMLAGLVADSVWPSRAHGNPIFAMLGMTLGAAGGAVGGLIYGVKLGKGMRPG